MTATLQWPLVSQHPLDFDFLAFGMGHASDFGMGLGLARPERKVIVWKGDGGLLMSLGSLVTMARYGPANLVVLLLENRTYEMVGGQPLPPSVDFVGLAHAAGMQTIAVTTTTPPEKLTQADAIVRSLKDVQVTNDQSHLRISCRTTPPT